MRMLQAFPLLPLAWGLRLEPQTDPRPANGLEGAVCLTRTVRLVLCLLLKAVLSAWGEGYMGGVLRAPAHR